METANGPFNVDHSIVRLKRGEILPLPHVHEMCQQLRAQLIYESNVQLVKSPVSVVGNLHGQFWDLLELFRVGGPPPDTNYIFLGDYVNFGFFSVETFSLLVCLKIRWPDRITLLRGNHESRPMTEIHGFYSECMRKYGTSQAWREFTDAFDYLATAAVVDGKIFCVHGGLSPQLATLDQIRVLNRFQEVSLDRGLCDLLWSDPGEEHDGFKVNPRGAGCTFGGDKVFQFLKTNQLDHIVRSHQLCLDGYQVVFQDHLTTVWSAPNFGGKCGNVASILEIDDKLNRHMTTFTSAPLSESRQPTLHTLKELPDFLV